MNSAIPSILITDDDAQFRATLCGVLEPRFKTLQAENGQEAMRIVLTQPVHLVVLDMHMPRWTGLETLRRLKQFRQNIPCILLSAALDEHLQRQAEQAHAFSVLSKPISRDAFTSVVEQAFATAYADGLH